MGKSMLVMLTICLFVSGFSVRAMEQRLRCVDLDTVSQGLACKITVITPTGESKVHYTDESGFIALNLIQCKPNAPITIEPVNVNYCSRSCRCPIAQNVIRFLRVQYLSKYRKEINQFYSKVRSRMQASDTHFYKLATLVKKDSRMTEMVIAVLETGSTKKISDRHLKRLRIMHDRLTELLMATRPEPDLTGIEAKRLVAIARSEHRSAEEKIFLLESAIRTRVSGSQIYVGVSKRKQG